MTTKARIQPGDGDRRHGTTNGYANHGCRCRQCRDAWAAYFADWKRRRSNDLASGEIEVGHGLASTYCNYGCRCAGCRAAWAAAVRVRRRRKAQAKAAES